MTLKHFNGSRPLLPEIMESIIATEKLRYGSLKSAMNPKNQRTVFGKLNISIKKNQKAINKPHNEGNYAILEKICKTR